MGQGGASHHRAGFGGDHPRGKASCRRQAVPQLSRLGRRPAANSRYGQTSGNSEVSAGISPGSQSFSRRLGVVGQL